MIQPTPTTTKPNGDLRSRIRFYLVDCQTLPGKLIDIGIIVLNILVCGLFVADTYVVSPTAHRILWITEIVVVAFFIMEYAARLYASENRARYVIGIFSLIDLLAIAPTVLDLLLPVLGLHINIDFILTLRMVRVIRIFRFIRFTADPDFFFGRITMPLLKILRLGMTIFIIFFVSSGIFYNVENGINPDIHNFGDAFYFTVVTLTTVGFGDITPASAGGRWVTVLMILSGIILIPWQASQVVKEWLHLSNKKEVICTRCGLAYHDRDASHCKACGKVIFQVYEGDD